MSLYGYKPKHAKRTYLGPAAEAKRKLAETIAAPLTPQLVKEEARQHGWYAQKGEWNKHP